MNTHFLAILGYHTSPHGHVAGLWLRHAGTRPGGTQRTGAAVEKTRGAQPGSIHGSMGVLWLVNGWLLGDLTI